jgi:hypothetical protein
MDSSILFEMLNNNEESIHDDFFEEKAIHSLFDYIKETKSSSKNIGSIISSTL